MSKGSQLLFVSMAFALVAASVYLAAASWGDPATTLDLLTGLLPAIFGGGTANVLAAVVLVFIAMYAFLFNRIRRNESLMAAQDAEFRASEQAIRGLQSSLDREISAHQESEIALKESLKEQERLKEEQERLKEELLQIPGLERQVEELREDAGEYRSVADSLAQSNRQLEETRMELRNKDANALHIEERAKAMHETAGRVMRAKDEFVDNVINDLRTPLVSIIGFSDSILQKAHGEIGHDRYEEYVQNMHNQATHLLELVDEALGNEEKEEPANVIDDFIDDAIGYETGGTEAEITSARINPKYAVALAHYAGFSVRTGNDQKLADALFQLAIAADPGNAVILGNYSLFRSTLREDHERVDALYQQILDADPDNVTLMLGYGVFLSDICKKHDRAEKVFRHAIATAPNHARGLGIYAGFLTRIREDFEHAETLYQNAVDADPDNARLLGDYARFLWKIRNNTKQAAELYQRAIEADPVTRKPRLAYAAFLLFNGQKDDGMPMLLQIAPDLWGEDLLQARFYQYAYGRHDTERAEGLKSVRDLLERKVRSPSFDPTDDVRYIVDAGHPEPELLDILGRVIGGRENIDVLDQYQAWRAFKLMKRRSPEPPAEEDKDITAKAPEKKKAKSASKSSAKSKPKQARKTKRKKRSVKKTGVQIAGLVAFSGGPPRRPSFPKPENIE